MLCNFIESDGEDNNKTAISSLDVKRIARKDLKRRASDSYRTQLGTPKNHVKGGTSSFEEVSIFLIIHFYRYPTNQIKF